MVVCGCLLNIRIVTDNIATQMPMGSSITHGAFFLRHVTRPKQLIMDVLGGAVFRRREYRVWGNPVKAIAEVGIPILLLPSNGTF
jgi:hypothetical protein